MSSFNKKTRNPGYQPGNHWVIDDVTGFAIREHDSMKTWDNLVTSKENFEPRHPQDFVRGVKDDTAPKGNIRSDDKEGVGRACKSINAVAGLAVAGCAIAGLGLEYYVPGSETISPDEA